MVLLIHAHSPVRKPIRLVYESESRSGRPHCQVMRSGVLGCGGGWCIRFISFGLTSSLYVDASNDNAGVEERKRAGELVLKQCDAMPER